MDAQELLPFMDRLIKPIADRLDHMDQRQREDTLALHQKIDNIGNVAATAAAAHAATDTLAAQIAEVSKRQGDQEKELARTDGRNQILAWAAGLIGAPIIVALALAGIMALFGIDLGGL